MPDDPIINELQMSHQDPRTDPIIKTLLLQRILKIADGTDYPHKSPANCLYIIQKLLENYNKEPS